MFKGQYVVQNKAGLLVILPVKFQAAGVELAGELKFKICDVVVRHHC